MQPLDWSLLPRAALGVLALLAGNGYIVGINQIYDVDIDTVSKPFLPIAAGTLLYWIGLQAGHCGGGSPLILSACPCYADAPVAATMPVISVWIAL